MGFGNSKERPHLVGCHFNFKNPGNWLKFVIIAEKIILSTVKLDDYTNIAIQSIINELVNSGQVKYSWLDKPIDETTL